MLKIVAERDFDKANGTGAASASGTMVFLTLETEVVIIEQEPMIDLEVEDTKIKMPMKLIRTQPDSFYKNLFTYYFEADTFPNFHAHVRGIHLFGHLKIMEIVQ